MRYQPSASRCYVCVHVYRDCGSVLDFSSMEPLPGKHYAPLTIVVCPEFEKSRGPYPSLARDQGGNE